MFAKDSAVIPANKNVNCCALNKHLACINSCFTDWKIQLNMSKYIAVPFTKKVKSLNNQSLTQN